MKKLLIVALLIGILVLGGCVTKKGKWDRLNEFQKRYSITKGSITEYRQLQLEIIQDMDCTTIKNKLQTPSFYMDGWTLQMLNTEFISRCTKNDI